MYQGRPVGLSYQGGSRPRSRPDHRNSPFGLDLYHAQYARNGQYVDLFNEQVRKVDVFVFDGAGQFLQQITEEAAPQFAENYTKEIELPAGDYQLLSGETTIKTKPGTIVPKKDICWKTGG